MKTRKSGKTLWIILGLLASVVIVTGVLGGRAYMKYQQEKQEQKLYKRAFRILEEQIAVYATEHYEGISKIEFSPIFEDGGDGYSMYTLKMVPVIYDNYGNEAMLGTLIDNVLYNSYKLHAEIHIDYDGADGRPYITLKDIDTGQEFDISKAEHLPKEAELQANSKFDENVEALVNDGQLAGVKKSDKGSPEAEVIYNTEIKRGDYKEWR